MKFNVCNSDKHVITILIKQYCNRYIMSYYTSLPKFKIENKIQKSKNKIKPSLLFTTLTGYYHSYISSALFY